MNVPQTIIFQGFQRFLHDIGNSEKWNYAGKLYIDAGLWGDPSPMGKPGFPPRPGLLPPIPAKNKKAPVGVGMALFGMALWVLVRCWRGSAGYTRGYRQDMGGIWRQYGLPRATGRIMA